MECLAGGRAEAARSRLVSSADPHRGQATGRSPTLRPSVTGTGPVGWPGVGARSRTLDELPPTLVGDPVARPRRSERSLDLREIDAAGRRRAPWSGSRPRCISTAGQPEYVGVTVTTIVAVRVGTRPSGGSRGRPGSSGGSSGSHTSLDGGPEAIELVQVGWSSSFSPPSPRRSRVRPVEPLHLGQEVTEMGGVEPGPTPEALVRIVGHARDGPPPASAVDRLVETADRTSAGSGAMPSVDERVLDLVGREQVGPVNRHNASTAAWVRRWLSSVPSPSDRPIQDGGPCSRW